MDVIVIHGYSSSAQAIKRSLGAALAKANRKRGSSAVSPLTLHVADYVSLDDQVTLEDVAEALYLELQRMGFLKGAGRTLKFVVHSTGAIVVRQLLKQYAWTGIEDRVATIVFLAPANFGSPWAHRGRSQLGRLKTMLIDGLLEGDTYVTPWQFGEVGEPILRDLELASPRQWALAEHDLLHPERGSLYTEKGVAAWVITGARSSSAARFVADISGTDGVIVTSGAGLSVRRLTIDLVRPIATTRDVDPGWSKTTPSDSLPSVPQLILEELDHETVLTDPEIADVVLDALAARTPAQRARLRKRFSTVAETRNRGEEDAFQQFIFRVRDDRGQPVPDYDVSFQVWSRSRAVAAGLRPAIGEPLFTKAVKNEERQAIRDHDRTMKLDDALRGNVHRHSIAHEQRRFLVNLSFVNRLLEKDDVLTFSLVADTGDSRLHYATERVNDVVIHPSRSGEPSLFYPNTTTLVDVTIDRWSEQGSVVQLK